MCAAICISEICHLMIKKSVVYFLSITVVYRFIFETFNSIPSIIDR